MAAAAAGAKGSVIKLFDQFSKELKSLSVDNLTYGKMMPLNHLI
ncbi:hypothetical protein [Bacillus xiapuensis]|nr:hypothetical protein [Bacillus xiapuensis]